MLKSEENKKTNKIPKIIITSVFSLVILIIVVYITVVLFAPRKVIKIFKFQTFVISSSSMEPTINYGDVIFVKPVNPEDLQENDIMTFYVDVDLDGKKEVVTHYVAAKRLDENGKLEFRTKRENTDIFDSWTVKEEDVVGRYNFQINQIGKVVLYIQSGFAIFIFIVDIILLYFIYLLMKSVENDRDTKKDKNSSSEDNILADIITIENESKETKS
jgi:signal peptidase I